MTHHLRMAVFALIATSLAAPIASGQQAPSGPPRTILEVPGFDPSEWYLQVAKVAPGGSVRIEADAGLQLDRPALAKGYYLLTVAPERSPGYPLLFRARVDEVADKNKVVVTVGPGAAGQIEEGKSCALVRSPGVAEDRLRALPDVIPCGRKPPESPAEAEAANLSRSTLNLKLIALAMANYESSNGSLPPAAILGPDGKPWHSWRVLLLPFVEQMELYEEYDFSEPWDGPKNRKLLDKMPDVYRDPIHGDPKGHDTHYAVLVGEWKGRSSTIHTAFPPSKVRMKSPRQTLSDLFTPDPRPKLAEATDGTEKTIAVVPVSPDRKIPWTKPEDVTVGPEFPGLGKPGGIAAPYRTGPKLDGPRAAPVIMLDFWTKVLLDTVNPKDLRALTTRDGGPSESLDLARVPTQEQPKPNFDPTKKPTLKVEMMGDGTARAWTER